MPAKAPVVHSISWVGVVVSLIPFTVLVALNAWFAPAFFPLLGAAVWLATLPACRWLLTGAHRRGVRLVKRGRFREAIPVFERALADIDRRPWIDRYRWLLLGSASRWSCREMALCNLADCHGQAGDGDRMRALYERVLAEFPNNILAASAMRMIRAVSEKSG